MSRRKHYVKIFYNFVNDFGINEMDGVGVAYNIILW